MKTNCAKNCSSEDEGKCQPFPKNGPLAKKKENCNLSLKGIEDRLKSSDGELYSYVVKTVEKENSNFCQTGSGPNFQGGYITLCSCMHGMRAFRDICGWKDVWIAGICKKDYGNALFYLMKVEKAFDSQYSLWNALPGEARKAKNARYSKFGDIYEPMLHLNNNEKYDPDKYYSPFCDNARQLKHVHLDDDNSWRKDINYFNRWCKGAAMLLGDQCNSFIWTKPTLFLKHPDGKKFVRGQKSWTLSNFLKQLQEQSCTNTTR